MVVPTHVHSLYLYIYIYLIFRFHGFYIVFYYIYDFVVDLRSVATTTYAYIGLAPTNSSTEERKVSIDRQVDR